MNKTGRQLLFESPPLTIIPELAEIIGLNEAIVLQQIMYWLRINERDQRNYYQGRFWVYNTIKDWKKTFVFFSEDTIRRALKNLRSMKLKKDDKDGFQIVLTENYNDDPSDRTLWYSIDLDSLDEYITAKRALNDVEKAEQEHDDKPAENDFLSEPFRQNAQMGAFRQNAQMDLGNLHKCLNTETNPETNCILVALKQDSEFYKLFNEFVADDRNRAREKTLWKILRDADHNESPVDDVIDAIRICVEKNRAGDTRYLNGILMNKAKDRDRGIIAPGKPKYWALIEVVDKRLAGYIKQGFISHYDVGEVPGVLMYELGRNNDYPGEQLIDMMRLVCIDVKRALGIDLVPRLKV